MQAKYIKKVYISLMSIVLLMLTAVTTTFAWVGFLDTTFFDDFEIDLKSSEVGEYGIELSLTGKEGTFANSIDNIEVKRAILKNMGMNNVDIMTDSQIESANVTMDQCTTQIMTNNALSTFTDVLGNTTSNYFKFDLYLRTFKSAEVEDNNSSTYYMDAFLNDNVFQGTAETKRLMNDFNYPTNSGVINFPKIYKRNPITDEKTELNFPSFTSKNLLTNPHVSGDITVNSLSACRLGIEIHDAVDLYDIRTNANVHKTIIYQGGTQYPTYNSSTGEYSFGGILPDDYNLAVMDYNNKIMQGYSNLTVPEYALYRGDLEYANDGVVNRVIDSNDSKVGINQMVKLTVYFWFEGWDADCFSIINQKPVSLKLSFSNYHYS